jgi:hypothetical protein
LPSILTGFSQQIARDKTRRDAREAEGAPLLREYRVKSLIEGSNPSLSASTKNKPRKGLFFVLAERERVNEASRFDKIVRNNFEQREALARSAKRGG